MSFDFYRGKIDINYTKPFTSGSLSMEYGWTEEYFFPVAAGADQTRINLRNLVAARTSLFPAGCSVFRARFSKASVFKSLYSLNGNAINPLLGLFEGYTQNVELANEVFGGVLYRLENGAGRRWQRLIAPMRDSWIAGDTGNYGLFAYDPVSSMAAPQVATTGGVQATATATVSGGGVNSVSITLGGGPYTIVPPVFFIGGANNASATAVLTGGVVTNVTGLVPGTGYTVPPTVYIPPPQNEPWGLMPGQHPNTYILNFLSCLGNYCINFHSIRVPNAAFPSGFNTQGDTVPSGGTSGYVATRILYQRVSDRQRGQIRTTVPGRIKRPI